MRTPIQGRGRVSFIVDQRGMVDTASIAVDSASSSEYALNMVGAVRRSKFMPATRLGCAVKSWTWVGYATGAPLP